MIDIERSLGLWIPQVQGQYINVDGAAGAQCWDLAAHWSGFLGLPRISTWGNGRWPGWAGNMVDAFPQDAEIAAAYDLIGPNEPMLPGDIVVWGDSYPAWYPKTHVAVGVLDQGANLVCMSQNSTPSQVGNPYPMWTTGPTVKQQLPRRGCIGLIRPRTGTINLQGTITEGDDLMSTKEDRALLIAELMTHPVKQPDGTVTNLESVIAENRAQHSDVIRVVSGVDEEVADDINKARDSINFSTQQQVEAVGRVTQQLIIDKAKPAVLVDQIVAAGIAKEVADELAKRLVK
jgi:hypothetical protein